MEARPRDSHAGAVSSKSYAQPDQCGVFKVGSDELLSLEYLSSQEVVKLSPELLFYINYLCVNNTDD